MLLQKRNKLGYGRQLAPQLHTHLIRVKVINTFGMLLKDMLTIRIVVNFNPHFIICIQNFSFVVYFTKNGGLAVRIGTVTNSKQVT